MWIGNCVARLPSAQKGEEHLQRVQSEFCLSAALAADAAVSSPLNIFNVGFTSHSQDTLYIDQTREKALCSSTSGDLHAKL